MTKISDEKFKKVQDKVDSFFQDKTLFFMAAGEILQGSKDPKDLDEILNLIHRCIDEYGKRLFEKVQEKPFSDLYEIIGMLQQEDDDTLKPHIRELLQSIDYEKMFDYMKRCGLNTPSNGYQNKLKSGNGELFQWRFNKIVKHLRSIDKNALAYIGSFLSNVPKVSKVSFGEFSQIQSVQIFYANLFKIASSLYRDNNDVYNALENNVEQFLNIIAKMMLIVYYANSDDATNVLNSILFFTHLTALDMSQINELAFGKEYGEFIFKKFSSENRKKGWGQLDKEYEKAIAMIVERWENGDTRWHYELTDEVAEEINEEIKDKIIAELLNKYPNKQNNKDQQEKFEKEKKKRFNYETISVGTLNKKIKDMAIACGRYYDPGAKYREKSGQ